MTDNINFNRCDYVDDFYTNCSDGESWTRRYKELCQHLSPTDCYWYEDCLNDPTSPLCENKNKNTSSLQCPTSCSPACCSTCEYFTPVSEYAEKIEELAFEICKREEWREDYFDLCDGRIYNGQNDNNLKMDARDPLTRRNKEVIESYSNKPFDGIFADTGYWIWSEPDKSSPLDEKLLTGETYGEIFSLNRLDLVHKLNELGTRASAGGDV